MRRFRQTSLLVSALAVVGCGDASTTRTTDPTADTISPHKLLDEMDAAIAAKLRYRMEMTLDGTTIGEGEVALGPPDRLHLRLQPPENVEIIVVGGVGYARQLVPPSMKWTRVPDDFLTDGQAGPLFQSYLEIFRVASLRVTSAPSVVQNGERLRAYYWDVAFKRELEAAGAPNASTAPDRATIRVLMDRSSLVREIKISSLRIALSRWGEPVDIKLPPKSQIE